MLGKPVPDFSLPQYRWQHLQASIRRTNTPGCTQQGSDFRDAYAAFQKAGTPVYGISRDTLKSHDGFKAKMKFPFESSSASSR